ncbi:MAG: thermonuclease family protein [Bradymonadaceae bacterium]|nr:thermonuclease family protein [Lujinxingiaceae bacterium]
MSNPPCGARIAWLILALLALVACDPARQNRLAEAPSADPATRLEAPGQAPQKGTGAKPSKLEPPASAQPGQLRAGAQGIVDGDTIRVVGFDNSIRLLQLDCEEVLKGDDLALADANWSAYVAAQSGDDDARIATYGTPLGNEATAFARDFFDGIEEVFVEYESPKRTRDFFGRHLAYVWIKRQGDVQGWLNYNLEAVRAGMSPYYTKYGYSARYHAAFEAAEAEAQQAGRGIWAKGARAYPDYARRKLEWADRAQQIAAFRDGFDAHEAFIELGSDTAMATLRQRLGQRVTLFGSVARFSPRGRPPKLHLAHRYRENVVVVASGTYAFARDLDTRQEEFVYVDGLVTLYRGNPQIELDETSRVLSGRTPPRP